MQVFVLFLICCDECLELYRKEINESPEKFGQLSLLLSSFLATQNLLINM